MTSDAPRESRVTSAGEPRAPAATEPLENLTIDEIDIGQEAELTRTLATRDIELFAAVSGDLNPTHLDTAFAEATGQPLTGHSLWAGLLVSSLLGNKLPGPGTVYRSQSLRFHRPPEVGDRVTVRIRVTAKDEAARTVAFDCDVRRQGDELLVDGTAEVLAPERKVSIEPVALPRVTLSHSDSFSELHALAEPLEPVTAAVVHPCEATALAGAVEAAEAGLIAPILVGPEARIRATAESAGLDIGELRIVSTPHSHASAEEAVALVNGGEAEILMKGSLHTDELMGAVVSRAGGLRTERRVSHVFVMDMPSYRGLLLVTDAAINIAPDLDDKRDICQNAIELAHTLGIAEPHVAILSAVETVTGKMPSTIEAAALCKMAERGQITGGRLDGPLAMDNAISREAALTKGIDSVVAGDADILLVPDLEAGNILAKQLIFLAHADAAGVVLGARVPIVLTSRADSVRTRLASCAVAKLQAHARRRQLIGGELPS